MTTPNIKDDNDKPFVWIEEAKKQYLASVDPKNEVHAANCARRSLAAATMNDTRERYIKYQRDEQQRLMQIIRDEIAALRPMGVASEISMAMGTRPNRGQLVGTPVGTYVFAKSRLPTEEQVDKWHETPSTASGTRTPTHSVWNRRFA